jgi:hypothetical protein
MESKWWCVDCRTPVDLDRHGRCGSCGSDAVDSMHRCCVQFKSPIGNEAILPEGLPQYAGAV